MMGYCCSWDSRSSEICFTIKMHDGICCTWIPDLLQFVLKLQWMMGYCYSWDSRSSEIYFTIKMHDGICCTWIPDLVQFVLKL